MNVWLWDHIDYACISHTHLQYIAFGLSQFIVVHVGLTAIAAQLPVDQFRWSGWFLCIHSGVLLILVVVFFRERWNDIRRTKGTVRAWQGRCPKVDLSNLPVPWYVSFDKEMENSVKINFYKAHINKLSMISDNFQVELFMESRAESVVFSLLFRNNPFDIFFVICRPFALTCPLLDHCSHSGCILHIWMVLCCTGDVAEPTFVR